MKSTSRVGLQTENIAVHYTELANPCLNLIQEGILSVIEYISWLILGKSQLLLIYKIDNCIAIYVYIEIH